MYFHHNHGAHQDPHSFPTRRSSDLTGNTTSGNTAPARTATSQGPLPADGGSGPTASRAPAPGGDRSARAPRSEEHTSELQSRGHLVCRLLLEKKKQKRKSIGH